MRNTTRSISQSSGFEALLALANIRKCKAFNRITHLNIPFGLLGPCERKKLLPTSCALVDGDHDQDFIRLGSFGELTINVYGRNTITQEDGWTGKSCELSNREKFDIRPRDKRSDTKEETDCTSDVGQRGASSYLSAK